MLDQWLSDPSKVGATVVLVAIVYAFYKVHVLPRQTHDATVLQIVTAHKDAIRKLEEDLSRERAEKKELKDLLYRNFDVADAALHTAEKAHQMRTKVRQAEGGES